MEYTIRKGTPDDFEAVLDMIKSLALFEKASEKVTNTIEQMQRDQKYFDFFVAQVDGEIVGMALYFFAYYTWVGKSLYLDDLFVKEAHRGCGIGQALIEKIFEIAKAEHCSRLRWQVLDWNKPAIELYRKMGATLDNEWINCDFDQNQIQEFRL
ncbi:MAG: GNAT family N-acetyltransferase [Bacteroidales bacterium]|nr:GNAT family N-acetyltransferase [Bacteroidales bacterium]